MQAITQEWVDKAEAAWGSMSREGQVQDAPHYDLACWLAQQCAKKYVKARLQEAGIPFPKTHNLLAFLALALPVEPSWNVLQATLTKLEDYGVDFHYPGSNAGALDA